MAELLPRKESRKMPLVRGADPFEQFFEQMLFPSVLRPYQLADWMR